MPNGLLVCKEDACQQLKRRACTHKLPCDHPCYGVKDEKEHPSCLEEACAVKDEKFLGTDLCASQYTHSDNNAHKYHTLTNHIVAALSLRSLLRR